MSFVPYPLKVKPIFKEKIWGGRRLSHFFKLPEKQKIGEVWFFADQERDCSIVSNGCYKGMSLKELLKKYSKEILGKKVSKKNRNKYPVLFKYIDSKERLSVQVHPDDKFARKNCLSSGKSEGWYILAAGKESYIYLGLKKITNKKQLENSIRCERIIEFLNKLKTKPGDGYYIPAGTIHSIGPSNIIFEIQQNIDITYRIFDWARHNLEVPRQLNIKDGLSALKIRNRPEMSTSIFKEEEKGIKTRILFDNKYFFTRELIVEKYKRCWYNQKAANVFALFEGSIELSGAFGKMRLQKGEVVHVPYVIKKFSFYASERLKCLVTEIR